MKFALCFPYGGNKIQVNATLLTFFWVPNKLNHSLIMVNQLYYLIAGYIFLHLPSIHGVFS